VCCMLGGLVAFREGNPLCWPLVDASPLGNIGPSTLRGCETLRRSVSEARSSGLVKRVDYRFWLLFEKSVTVGIKQYEPRISRYSCAIPKKAIVSFSRI